jgi:hypothetical protein
LDLPSYQTQYKQPFADAAAKDSYCGTFGDRPAYRVFDLDGDAKPDIVFSYDCQDGAVGTSRWSFHSGR